MPADIVTIPRLLKQGGYTTGAFGKWGLGAPGSPSDPMEHFDRFYGYNCQRQAHTYYPDHLWSDREKVALDGKTYAHDLISKETLQFIRDNKDKPFFAYLAITIPHAAMHIPEDYAAPFRKKFPQFEDKIGRYKGPEVRNPIAAFAGMMTKVDDDVGDVLNLLEELGIDDNTLISLHLRQRPPQGRRTRTRFFRQQRSSPGIQARPDRGRNPHLPPRSLARNRRPRNHQ